MPRKGENIYRRKDGRWEGRYIESRTPSGKANYRSIYGKSYREVKAKLLETAASKHNTAINKPTISSDLFKHIAMEWFETNRLHVKESTNNKYWNLLNSYILPMFGEQPLHCVTHDFIESQCNMLLYSGGVSGTGLSPKTVTDIISVVRSILQFAVKKGRFIPCDAQAVRIKHSTSEMRVLSRSEQEKLCQYLYSHLDAYNIGILICLFTGLRVGEICALRWEDISFNDHTISVHQTMQRIQNRSGTGPKTKIIVTPPKSACSIRTIPVPDDLINIIASYRTVSTGFVLANNNQQFVEPRTMQNRFKKALKMSSVAPANYHCLRHTFATRCVELGFDVKSLSEILGHASVNITMNRYVHPSMELKKENMKRLSTLLAVK